MSHFTEMKVNFLQKNQKEFVAALEEIFGAGKVEVHENGAPLFGYGGDNRANLKSTNPNYAPLCHIIIRRQNVGSSSNDVGYRKTEDGGYVAYISEFDQTGNFNTKRQNKVAQEYAVKVTEKTLKNKYPLYQFKKVKQSNGGVQLIASKYG